MIITPTRELARQVFQVATPFWKTVPWIETLLLTGGSYVLTPTIPCKVDIKGVFKKDFQAEHLQDIHASSALDFKSLRYEFNRRQVYL